MILKERIIEKQRIFTGKFLALEKWNTILSNNKTATREIVIPPDAVGIVPVDDSGRLHLIRQARPAVDDILYEIPAGIIDAGETVEETARRECGEEIGLIPHSLTKLITYYHAEGYTTGLMTLFLGTELKLTNSLQTDTDEILEHLTIPLDEAVQWLKHGRFKDSKSMLGIMFAKNLYPLNKLG